MPVADTVWLSREASLKRLEEPCVYRRDRDDLYELTEDAFGFLERSVDGAPAAGADPEFLETCLAEGILVREPRPTREPGGPRRGPRIPASPPDLPSLRYLLVHLTRRCNLACAHCYLGEAQAVDLPLESLRTLLDDFEQGGGLRLLLSGGEPLLHPDFWKIDALLPSYDVRSVLLTNGTLIDDETAARLHTHEVQVSLDGTRAAHDTLRGDGSFDAAVAGLRAARRAGLEVSIASTVNALDLDDFDELAALADELDVWQWNIDVPSPAGRFAGRDDLWAPLDRAVPLLDHARPGGNHGGNDGHTCGAHLAAVLPDGAIVKCGLLADVHGGHADDGLQNAWRRLPHLQTATLDEPCRSCGMLESCRGGCRFRAGGLHSSRPDPVQCHRFGVLSATEGRP
jgi:radical SAM protein with 4Fe4S-binding SPASM domain